MKKEGKAKLAFSVSFVAKGHRDIAFPRSRRAIPHSKLLPGNYILHLSIQLS